MYAAIKGYAKIEQGGYKNDKIRLKNMFVGIQDKAEAPKVIDSSLLREASNYDCIRSHGFLTQATKDIYLAP